MFFKPTENCAEASKGKGEEKYTIFEALQKEELTLEELIEKVCAEYEVEKEVATKDVTVFCENLKKNKILD